MKSSVYYFEVKFEVKELTSINPQLVLTALKTNSKRHRVKDDDGSYHYDTIKTYSITAVRFYDGRSLIRLLPKDCEITSFRTRSLPHSEPMILSAFYEMDMLLRSKYDLSSHSTLSDVDILDGNEVNEDSTSEDDLNEEEPTHD